MPLWMSPRTACTASERKPSDRIASSTPCAWSQSSMKLRNGRPASGSTGLGVVSVSGRRRVPSPPASTSACISGPTLGRDGRGDVGCAADTLVREARCDERVAVEEVAAVDDQGVGHDAANAIPVELEELWPFGDQHSAVGTFERLLCAGADLSPIAQ